ncbi:hypothetical protein DPM19_19705 [Actinomadura craniellae]|uniref:Acyl-CoA synthetase n=2 Tax=Actinomadura craniellae TaxID=2231787 RepID=A0A365H513_9ACTN|nr:hypothetical protein DPM19_19705 [Actinomadura craniellae]
MLRPVRPDRAARMWPIYRRLGPTPAAVGALAALRFPNRTAVIDDAGSLTFAELDRRATALATVLDGLLDGRPGSVGILCRNHRGFIVALLAAGRLGRDVVLLNTDFSAVQLGEVMAREEVGLLVHDAEFADTVQAASFDGVRLPAEDLAEQAETTGPKPVKPSRPGRVIILTSGTTGTPKGARHDLSLRMLMAAAFTHMNRVRTRSGEPVVLCPPLFHVLGLGYCTLSLSQGSPVVLLRRFDPAAVLAAIERHRARAMVAVPVMLQRLLDLPPPAGSPLRTVLCGGSALSPRLADAFMDAYGDILRNAYGATETGWAAIATPEDLRAAPGTVGRPTLGITVRILDAEGRELPTGQTGEIFVGGGIKFSGYTGGGGRRTREGLSGTGDLGHFDPEGRLFVDGRADDMIVSGGENVFPGEVEALLQAHPGITDAAVTGVDDEDFGQRLAAFVVLAEDSELTADDVRAYAREQLARYKVPRDVTFVEEIPRTASGKIKHNTLRT